MAGLVAFKRRASVPGLQAFEVGAFGENVGDRQRDRDAAAGAVKQRVLRDRQQLIVRPHGGNRSYQFHLACLAHRAGRNRRDEAATGAGERRALFAGGVFQHDDAGDEALRGGAMLFDRRFGDGGQAGIHSSPVKPSGSDGRYTSEITRPPDRIWTL